MAPISSGTGQMDSLPIAQYAIDLGDTFLALGDTQKANQSYQLARLAYEKSEAGGVDTDLEMALFLADHTIDFDLALTKAEAAYKDRPNIFAADTLSWVYYKRNAIAEAKKYSTEALRLGEHDPLILFHAGMIAKKNNEPLEARRYIDKALKTNPYFSLQYTAIAKDFLKNQL
jgi:tetratricopeptide (TPR) repeat protein